MTEEQPVLVRAAKQLAGIAAQGAAYADSHGRLSHEVVKAVLEAGFARHFVPAEWGGAAGGFAELGRAVAEVGQGCASTAWFASLSATLGRMAGYLPTEGQRQVWAQGPDAVVVGSLMPSGTASEAPGGWRVKGRWPFVSSVEFSDWALVLGAPMGELESARFLALPRRTYSIEETWSSLGMRATGSHTLVVDDALVPVELTFTREDLYAGRPCESAEPSGRVPLKAVSGLSFAMPMLGTARSALLSWKSMAGTRVARGAVGVELADYQLALARSTWEVDAAEMVLDRVARVADRGVFTELLAARCALDCALAAEMLVTSTDRLVRMAGTSAMSEGNALQRAWRDVRSAATHGTLRVSSKAAVYAQREWENMERGQSHV